MEHKSIKKISDIKTGMTLVFCYPEADVRGFRPMGHLNEPGQRFYDRRFPNFQLCQNFGFYKVKEQLENNRFLVSSSTKELDVPLSEINLIEYFKIYVSKIDGFDSEEAKALLTIGYR